METSRPYWVLCFANTKVFVGPYKSTVVKVEDAQRFDTKVEAENYALSFRGLLNDLPYPISVVMTCRYNLDRE